MKLKKKKIDNQSKKNLRIKKTIENTIQIKNVSLKILCETLIKFAQFFFKILMFQVEPTNTETVSKIED